MVVFSYFRYIHSLFILNEKRIICLKIKSKCTLGLFKNVQMQGAQKLNREAYITYVERCGLQRNAADGHFVKAFRLLPAWNIIIHDCTAHRACAPGQQPCLWHIKNLYPRRWSKLKHFLHKSRINGNIGKSQRGRIAHNVIKAYLQNIKIVSINCKIN